VELLSIGEVAQKLFDCQRKCLQIKTEIVGKNKVKIFFLKYISNKTPIRDLVTNKKKTYVINIMSCKSSKMKEVKLLKTQKSS